MLRVRVALQLEAAEVEHRQVEKLQLILVAALLLQRASEERLIMIKKVLVKIILKQSLPV